DSSDDDEENGLEPDAIPGRHRSSTPPPKPPTPARADISQAAASAVRARDTGELLLLGALKNFGIDDAGAARLIALHGADRCWPQVRAMRLRLEQHHAAGDPIRHPGRFLRRAIEQNYELPDALRAELVAVPPPRRRARDAARRRGARRAADPRRDRHAAAAPACGAQRESRGRGRRKFRDARQPGPSARCGDPSPYCEAGARIAGHDAVSMFFAWWEAASRAAAVEAVR